MFTGMAGQSLFSASELAILQLLCQGYTKKEIAQLRNRSPRTIAAQISALDAKISPRPRPWNGVRRLIWAVENGYAAPPAAPR